MPLPHPEAVVDRHGDVWTPGPDGLLYTPETRPFPRDYIERKWGPLRLVNRHAAAVAQAEAAGITGLRDALTANA